MFYDFFPYSVIVTNTKSKKGDMLYIFLMWIPRYIDMNPHFSQNILNKGIFQMWIHHYIDMNPQFCQNVLNKGIFNMWIHRYIDMYPHCLGIKYKKGDMLVIF